MNQTLASALEAVAGWLTPAEAELLYGYARVSDAPIVEVGSFQGRSSVVLALGSLHGLQQPVFCVDPHALVIHAPGKIYGPDDLAMWYINISRFCVGAICRKICLPSHDAAGCFQDKSLSMVFIDGLHDYNSVCEDVLSWVPKLRVGGFLVFHDRHELGPAQVIRELLAGEHTLPHWLDQVACVDSIAVLAIDTTWRKWRD